jgi:hypothetical protein
MENANDRSKELPEINADYIDQLLSYQPPKKEPVKPAVKPVEPPTPPEEAPPPEEKENFFRKNQKALIVTAVAVLCLLLFLCFRNPFANISDEQWIAICQENYDRLIGEEALHYTLIENQSTIALSTNSTMNVWFSGDDFYKITTNRNGAQQAVLVKDGTYYTNYQPDLPAFAWATTLEYPGTVRWVGTWDTAGYTLVGSQRNNKEMEVTFSKNASTSSARQTRMKYLTFRFNKKLEVIAVIHENVLYTGQELAADKINSSTTREYILHPAKTEDIIAEILAPLQAIEEYQRERAKWATITAAVYEELCARTVLHYTSKSTSSVLEYELSATASEEGWICRKDSLSIKKQKDTELIQLNRGNSTYTKSSLDGANGSWMMEERTPAMHPMYQDHWNASQYTFEKIETTKNGTNITFRKHSFYPSTDDSYVVDIFSGRSVTFCLDKDINLYKIIVTTETDGADAQSRTVLEYQFHDITEKQAMNEIEKYYQMVTDNS